MKRILIGAFLSLLSISSAEAFPLTDSEENIIEYMDSQKVNVLRSISSETYYVRLGGQLCALDVTQTGLPGRIRNGDVIRQVAGGECRRILDGTGGVLSSQSRRANATITSIYIDSLNQVNYSERILEFVFLDSPNSLFCAIYAAHNLPSGRQLYLYNDDNVYSQSSCDSYYDFLQVNDFTNLEPL